MTIIIPTLCFLLSINCVYSVEIESINSRAFVEGEMVSPHLNLLDPHLGGIVAEVGKTPNNSVLARTTLVETSGSVSLAFDTLFNNSRGFSAADVNIHVRCESIAYSISSQFLTDLSSVSSYATVGVMVYDVRRDTIVLDLSSLNRGDGTVTIGPSNDGLYLNGVLPWGEYVFNFVNVLGSSFALDLPPLEPANSGIGRTELTLKRVPDTDGHFATFTFGILGILGFGKIVRVCEG